MKTTTGDRLRAKRKAYQPKTGQRCTCKPGQQRDNCPACEGMGWQIDFRAIREGIDWIGRLP